MNTDQQSHFPSGLLDLFVHVEAVLHYLGTAGTISRIYIKIIHMHNIRISASIFSNYNTGDIAQGRQGKEQVVLYYLYSNPLDSCINNMRFRIV